MMGTYIDSYNYNEQVTEAAPSSYGYKGYGRGGYDNKYGRYGGYRGYDHRYGGYGKGHGYGRGYDYRKGYDYGGYKGYDYGGYKGYDYGGYKGGHGGYKSYGGWNG